MKSNLTKSLASLKGIFTKVIVAGTLTAAVLLAVPDKASAQQFSVGVRFGHPVYGPVYAPAYGPVYGPGPGFYAERRHEEFIRHDRWARDREFHNGYRPYNGYNR